MTRTTESLKAHSRALRPLSIGEQVFLQNQQGPNPAKWDRSGVLMESPGHDQYRVKVDGSGRLTLRNHRFLRAYTPATPSITPRQQTASGARQWQMFPPTAAAPDCLQEEEPQETIAPPDPTKHTAGDPPTPLASAGSGTIDDPPTMLPQSPQTLPHHPSRGLGGMKGPPADQQSARNYR